MKRGEIEKWRESFRENCACAGGIDILIRENFDGMHLKDGTVEKIVELYGYKRVEHVLANTVPSFRCIPSKFSRMRISIPPAQAQFSRKLSRHFSISPRFIASFAEYG